MLKSTSVLLAASTWLLAACSSEPTCDYSKEPYMAAQSVPPLRAPDGLTTPDRTASLVIPPPSDGAKPIPKGDGRCLDRPPSYFATAPDKKETDKKEADNKKSK
jgi:uncharacterized lipoprotein